MALLPRLLVVLLATAALLGAAVTAGDSVASAAEGPATALHPEQGDMDGDEVPDANDNCPRTVNRDQIDTDGDGFGDACDENDDDDLWVDSNDNCRTDQNNDQLDTDQDGAGDVCDVDTDQDGVRDDKDNCRGTKNPDQANLDADGLGDACDGEADGDGIANGPDNCDRIPNEDQHDGDADGIGSACDDNERTASDGTTTFAPPPGDSPGPGTVAPSGRPGPPRLSLRLLRRTYRRAELGSGVPVSARCSEQCTLSAQLTVGRTRAGGGTAKLGDAGATWIFVKLTPAATARLRRKARVRLTLTVTATDAAGENVKRRRTVVFRR